MYRIRPVLKDLLLFLHILGVITTRIFLFFFHSFVTTCDAYLYVPLQGGGGHLYTGQCQVRGRWRARQEQAHSIVHGGAAAGHAKNAWGKLASDKVAGKAEMKTCILHADSGFATAAAVALVIIV